MILFVTVAMVDQSPALAQRINKSGGAGKEWNLAFLQTGSFFGRSVPTMGSLVRARIVH
jgi:hypothetical protein